MARQLYIIIYVILLCIPFAISEVAYDQFTVGLSGADAGSNQAQGVNITMNTTARVLLNVSADPMATGTTCIIWHAINKSDWKRAPFTNSWCDFQNGTDPIILQAGVKYLIMIPERGEVHTNRYQAGTYPTNSKYVQWSAEIKADGSNWYSSITEYANIIGITTNSTSSGGAPPSIQGLPDNPNLAPNNKSSFISNFSVNCSYAGNVTFWIYVNELPYYKNVSKGVTGNTYYNFTTNLSDGQQIIKCAVQNVSATSGGNFSAGNTTNYYYIDTVTPLISTGLSKTPAAIWRNSSNLSLWVNVSDNNLFSLKINSSIETIMNVSNLTGTTLNYTLGINLTKYGSGLQSITVRVADGHTAKEIPTYLYDKNPLTNALTFSFNKGSVTIKPNGILTDLNTEKQKDRYIFQFTKTFGSSASFTVYSTDYIEIIDRPPYRGWLVIDALGKWVDFEQDNPLAKYTIVRNSPQEVTVLVDGIGDKATFNSMGDLNIYTQSYQFGVLNATEIFTQNITEQQNVTYAMNITKVGNTTTQAHFENNGISQTLNYVNGTSYDYYYAYVAEPIVSGGTTSNTSVNWTINTTGGGITDTYGVNRTDTVNQILLRDCGTPKTQTFTVFDADKLEGVSPYKYSGTWTVWNTINPAYTRTYSFSTANSSLNNSICIFPNFAKYTASHTSTFIATGFSNSQAIETSVSLDNTERVSVIYLTNSSKVSSLIISIVDEYDAPLSGYRVDAYRYDLTNGSLTLIDSQTADMNGQTLFSLNVVDYDYSFYVYDTASVLKLVQPHQKLISTSYTLVIQLGGGVNNIIGQINTLDINLFADTMQKWFILNWSSIGIVANNIIFEVKQTNATGGLLLYSNTSSLTSSSMQYTLPEPYNTSGVYIGTVKIRAAADNNTYFVTSASLDIRPAWDIFGSSEVMLMSFMFIGTMLFLGLFFSPTAAFMLTGIGIIVFYQIGFLMISLSGIGALMILFLIVIWRSQ